MDRTKSTVRNIKWGMINKVIGILLPFLTRSVLIYKLGSEYVGLNSLFTSILQILSLTELGLGSAITYSLYRPIAEDDVSLICSLLKLYKKIYRYIGVAIILMGVVLTPFLQKLIHGNCPQDINLYILYVMYITNTAVSYLLFAYRSVLLTAHNRSDITNKIQLCILIFQNISQIVALTLFNSYYFYIAVLITSTIFNNIVVNIITKRIYPLYICAGEVPKEVKGQLKKQVAGIVISKVCAVLRNSFDSIILSAFLGLTLLGKYQNYYFVINALCGFTTIIVTSMTAGVGNRIIKESADSNYNLISKLNYIYMWISGVISISLSCLYQDFIQMWIGSSNLFGLEVVVSMALYFYVMKLSEMIYVVKEASGLWWEDRYRPLIEGLTNLALNIILVRKIGVLGVVYSTIITMFISDFFIMTWIVFKKYFKKSMKEYFIRQLVYFVRTAFVGGILFVFYGKFWPSIESSYLNFVLKGFTVVCLSNLLFVALSYKDNMFGISFKYIKGVLKKVVG